MTLEQLARKAGVTLFECEPEWGGRIAYKSADCPNSAVCGFRTNKAALNHWFKDAFGEHIAKAIKPLLKKSP